MTEMETIMDEVRTLYATRSKDENTKLSEIRVNPPNPPQFSGNIKHYASFRHDFQRLMTKQFGKDAFALRQCLKGDALETVSGIEDDYEEMFRRLDSKYGEPRKLVDAVIYSMILRN